MAIILPQTPTFWQYVLKNFAEGLSAGVPHFIEHYLEQEREKQRQEWQKAMANLKHQQELEAIKIQQQEMLERQKEYEKLKHIHDMAEKAITHTYKKELQAPLMELRKEHLELAKKQYLLAVDKWKKSYSLQQKRLGLSENTQQLNSLIRYGNSLLNKYEVLQTSINQKKQEVQKKLYEAGFITEEDLRKALNSSDSSLRDKAILVIDEISKTLQEIEILENQSDVLQQQFLETQSTVSSIIPVFSGVSQFGGKPVVKEESIEPSREIQPETKFPKKAQVEAKAPPLQPSPVSPAPPTSFLTLSPETIPSDLRNYIKSAPTPEAQKRRREAITEAYSGFFKIGKNKVNPETGKPFKDEWEFVRWLIKISEQPRR